MFLYIDPLKQGLKLTPTGITVVSDIPFLYIDPLKQGLKQVSGLLNILPLNSFYT